MRTALAIREKAFNAGHESIAISLNDMAYLQKLQGNFDVAQALCQRAAVEYHNVKPADFRDWGEASLSRGGGAVHR